jgi:hypothetical protein
MDEEERSRVMEAETQVQLRARKLYEREADELSHKQARRVSGKEALA